MVCLMRACVKPCVTSGFALTKPTPCGRKGKGHAMATFEFVLPELGEGMEAGDVVQVLVSVGESITEEQPVLELETDKAVVEVPAPVSGTVKAIHVQSGDKAAVGQLLLTVETSVATAAAAPAPPTSPPAAVSPPPPSEHDDHRTATAQVVPRPP